MDDIKVYRQKNGLELIFAKIPFLESCTVSIMIKTGSIYESDKLRGGAHVLEHLLFKGNKQYPNQLDLSKTLESMGAQYNAYTDTNLVSFHVKVQKKYIKEVINILGNMISNSYIRKSDLESEKMVVVQELEKDKDSPVRYVYELIAENIYKGSNYSRPVGGNKNTVLAINQKEIEFFWKSNYNSKNIVISVAGNVEIEDLQEYLETSPFMNGDLPIGKNNDYSEKIEYQNHLRYNYEVRKDMNQVQLCVAFPTFDYNDERKYALEVLKVILAGPMSSRLFVALRNTYGISYNVSAHTSLNNLLGDITISSGVDGSELFSNNLNIDNKKKADPLKVILQEIFNLVKVSPTEEEIVLSKEYIKGSLILDSEDTENISQYYGKQRIVGNNIITLQRYINCIDNVTRSDVFNLAKQIFKPNTLNISLIGKLDESKLKKYMSRLESRYTRYIKE